ncbi:flavodoxin-like fold family protein NDAI_0G04400 [Naumovozyma dairenensis CBS 421]|uniref:Flavodoxin-like domain-containing protein n=1 Tax=Naumovozyma dairenensis (strain ATCC 10597 / BCRC 20456 / CBS 421 / NBRC 0211 / NRRL Y-12639) TaxID=1071378 RepID=J7SBN2_NAUDC|nr:hypothetical protein NDAI_0G04400 [Naumovozyma dairenensis CBS 421]CCK73425.1 hypothetical protein NDAI_0G04400 [Naumovozyma dairenensis CBS 421]
MVKVAIITYSTYGHITTLARSIQKGVESAGGKADLFRVEETLPDEVLEQMNAPAKPDDIPVATEQIMGEYDAFLFGVPTRFGTMPAQWSSFWDKTGAMWAQGTLNGKVAGFFVSTSGYGGGQESTVKNCLSYLVHHGIIYVPLGYRDVFAELSNVEEVHGGSPWGAGTLAGADGSRQASELELRIAEIQGKTFYEAAKKFPSSVGTADAKAKTTNKGAAEKKPVEKKTTTTAKRTTAAPAAKTEEKKEEKKDEGLMSCCVVM